MNNNKIAKVLLINGSPHVNGCTNRAFIEICKILNEENIETEVIQIGQKDIRGCIGCYKCQEAGKCVFNDILNEIAPKFRECDALIVGSPVYYAGANGTLISFLNRLFFSSGCDPTMKLGAAVVSARRGGCTSTFDELNKFFTMT